MCPLVCPADIQGWTTRRSCWPGLREGCPRSREGGSGKGRQGLLRSAGAAVPEETGQAVGVVQGVAGSPAVTLLWGFSLLLPAAQTKKALFLIGNPPFPRGQHVIERIPADTRSGGERIKTLV